MVFFRSSRSCTHCNFVGIQNDRMQIKLKDLVFDFFYTRYFHGTLALQASAYLLILINIHRCVQRT